MKTKHLGIAGLLLACALVLAGCDNPGGGGGGGGGGDDDGDKTYVLGDTGPGGGKIFYVSEAGFTMTDNNQVCHYLEAAPADISGTKAWVSGGHIISGTAGAIGTGRKNTALILAVDNGDNAAKACQNLTAGGKHDWFLPSKDELNALYTKKDDVGNLGTNWYWSSSQLDDNNAWPQNFSNGNQEGGYYNNKGGTHSVRAVRAF